jgi:hypothetical protein
MTTQELRDMAVVKAALKELAIPIGVKSLSKAKIKLLAKIARLRARAKQLAAQERRESARKAVLARWKKAKEKAGSR